MTSKSYVSVRCRYYKHKAALAVLDHAHHQRNGFTRSQNVHSEFTEQNTGYYFHDAYSCAEALEMMCQRHKALTGKKVRVDNNVLFEHVVCLSEYQYKRLELKYSPERVKRAAIEKLKQYMMAIKSEFGFEPLGLDLHFFDEGHYELTTDEEGPTKRHFVRNIHAHCQFMNFDFSEDKLVAPLRHLMKRGKDKDGKTRKLNPNFEKIQSVAYETFKSWGFQKGKSKTITGTSHLPKESFVRREISNLEKRAANLRSKNEMLQKRLEKRLCEFETVKSNMGELGDKVRKLRAQINDLNALKNQLSKAISECSEVALREVIKNNQSAERAAYPRR